MSDVDKTSDVANGEHRDKHRDDDEHDFKLYVKLSRSLSHALAHFVRGNDTVSSRAVLAATVDLLLDVAINSGVSKAKVMVAVRDTWEARYQDEASRGDAPSPDGGRLRAPNRELEPRAAGQTEPLKRAHPVLYLPQPLR